MNNPCVPRYSLDASALIELKDIYPRDITLFQPMWNLLGDLSAEGRVLVAEPARDECKDKVLKELFAAHAEMIIHVVGELNDYVNALSVDLEVKSMRLVDPSSTENRADPFVIALALMAEGRDIKALGAGSATAKCAVIAYEKRRPTARLSRIPDVCGRYNLECI